MSQFIFGYFIDSYFKKGTVQDEVKAAEKNGITQAAFWGALSEEEKQKRMATLTRESRATEEVVYGIVKKKYKTDLTYDSLRTLLEKVRRESKDFAKEYLADHADADPDVLPTLSEISPEERERRRKLRERWSEKVMRESIRMHTQISNLDILEMGEKIDRVSQILMAGGSYEDQAERMAAFRNMTPAERRDFFVRRASEVMDFLTELQEYKTDEEFLRITEGKRWMLGFAAEMDKKSFLKDFGFDEAHPLPADFEEKWNFWRDVAVDTGRLQNRLDQIVTPMYEIVNTGELQPWFSYLDNLDEFDRGLSTFGYTETEGLTSPMQFGKILADEKATINPFYLSEKVDRLELDKTNPVKSSIQSAVRFRLFADMNEVRYYDKDGRSLRDLNAAAKKLLAGEKITVKGKIADATLELPNDGPQNPQVKTPDVKYKLTSLTVADVDKMLKFMKDANGFVRRDRVDDLVKLYVDATAKYNGFGSFRRLFNGGMKAAIDHMREVFPANGISNTRIMMAMKKDNVTETDVKERIEEIKSELGKINGNPTPEQLRKLASLQEDIVQLKSFSDEAFASEEITEELNNASADLRERYDGKVPAGPEEVPEAGPDTKLKEEEPPKEKEPSVEVEEKAPELIPEIGEKN